jgi:thiol-disulfide isomerase/thioredoxin
MRQLGTGRRQRIDHSGATKITFVATGTTDLIGSNTAQKSLRLIAVILATLCCGSAGLIGSITRAEVPPAVPKANVAENPYPHRVAAPALEGGEWVNTPAPLAIADLRGRFVLLDFWTFCCINCMHLLPELNKLEHAFPNELVVIGVHSAKFQGERDTDNIREAVLRYEIEHPVVNDAKMTIWGTYGARSWPTLVLIDPAGDVVWAASGERSFDEIKAVIDRGLPYYRAQGLLKPAPRPTIIGASKQPATALRYPGKILADVKGGRLFVADSNHNRIVVAKLDGKLEHVKRARSIIHKEWHWLGICFTSRIRRTIYFARRTWHRDE